jgi:hypothetical protein
VVCSQDANTDNLEPDSSATPSICACTIPVAYHSSVGRIAGASSQVLYKHQIVHCLQPPKKQDVCRYISSITRGLDAVRASRIVKYMIYIHLASVLGKQVRGKNSWLWCFSPTWSHPTIGLTTTTADRRWVGERLREEQDRVVFALE